MIIMELSIKSTRIKGALTQYTYENVLVCTPDIPLPRPWHLFIRVVTLGLNKTFRAVQFKDKTYSGHKTMLCKRKCIKMSSGFPYVSIRVIQYTKAMHIFDAW